MSKEDIFKEDIIYERDLLFATDDSNEIGVVKVKLYGAKKSSKITAVIEEKSEHDPLQYVESVLHSLDVEMFKRININIIDNIDVIFINSGKALRVAFESKDSYNPYHLEEVELSDFEV